MFKSSLCTSIYDGVYDVRELSPSCTQLGFLKTNFTLEIIWTLNKV
jgi:hypothetical protein